MISFSSDVSTFYVRRIVESFRIRLKHLSMKNEPVVTYNHMEEDNASNQSQHLTASGEKSQHPISLYMILVADVILIGFIVYVALRAIF